MSLLDTPTISPPANARVVRLLEADEEPVKLSPEERRKRNYAMTARWRRDDKQRRNELDRQGRRRKAGRAAEQR